jgi:hypothetical protein
VVDSLRDDPEPTAPARRTPITPTDRPQFAVTTRCHDAAAGTHTDSVRASASTSYGHGLGSAHPSRRRETSSPRYQRSNVIGSRFVTSLRSSCISTRTDPMSVGTDALVGPDTAGAAPNASPERRTAASAAAPDRHLRGRPTARRVSPRPNAVDAELQCPVCGSDVKVANLVPHLIEPRLGPHREVVVHAQPPRTVARRDCGGPAASRFGPTPPTSPAARSQTKPAGATNPAALTAVS